MAQSPEVQKSAVDQLVEAKLKADAGVRGKLDKLGGKIENGEKQTEMREAVTKKSEAVDAVVKELLQKTLNEAQKSQLNVVAWTEKIWEEAKANTLNAGQRGQLLMLVAKVTARKGMPQNLNEVIQEESKS